MRETERRILDSRADEPIKRTPTSGREFPMKIACFATSLYCIWVELAFAQDVIALHWAILLQL